MNTNQKGFINNILVVVIIVLVVGVAGYFAIIKKPEPITQQPVPTLTQTTAPTNTLVVPTPTTIDETANWTIYNNPGLNFSINYPNDFQLTEDNATSKLFSGTDGHFWIFVENNTKNLDAAGIKDDYYKHDEYGYQYQDTFVKVAGANAYKQGRYDLGVIERYYIPKNGKIYKVGFEFNFDTPNQNIKENKINLIRNIISTFKFEN
ncbi:MAG: hypothetical protein WC659_02380 [Patescibacteria group bacterium]